MRRIGLIDFQDAVIGPPAYDLASLLQDARVDVPDDLEMRLAALYMRRRASADPAFDATRFAAAYAAMGAQRATKILGLFARLDKRDGKPQYLRHLPRIERYLAKNLAHPLLQPLALWYQDHLPRALGQAASRFRPRERNAEDDEHADSENGHGVRCWSWHADASDHRCDPQAARQGRAAER